MDISKRNSLTLDYPGTFQMSKQIFRRLEQMTWWFRCNSSWWGIPTHTSLAPPCANGHQPLNVIILVLEPPVQMMRCQWKSSKLGLKIKQTLNHQQKMHIWGSCGWWMCCLAGLIGIYKVTSKSFRYLQLWGGALEFENAKLVPVGTWWIYGIYGGLEVMTD